MFFDNYPISTSKLTSSIFFKGLKASPAVLLIHGFSGTPYEMHWLAKQLNDAGYNVSVPRLPGHGTCKKDFLSSTWKDWLRCVCDNYIDLSAQYEGVYVAGHSMGGLLATILARYFDVQKLVLLAPAFCVKKRGTIPLWLTPIAKYFVKEVKKNDGIFFKDEEFNNATEEYRKSHFIAKYADFYKINKMAKKALPYIKCKSLIVLAKKDNIATLENKDLIEKKVNMKCDYLMLEKGGHLVQCDAEKENVARSMIEFLKA